VTWPPLLALISAFGFGLASVLLRRGLLHARPVAATLVSVTFTAVFIWALAVATVPPSRLFTWRVLPFVAAGFVAPGLGRLFLFMGFDRIGVARAITLSSTTPLFSVALAIAFLGERPPSLLFLGVAAIVMGGALLSHRPAAERSWRRRHMVFPLLAALSFALRDLVSRWGLRAYGEPLVGAAVSAGTSLLLTWAFAVGGAGTGGLGLSRGALRLFALAGVAEGTAYLTMWGALGSGDVSLVSPLVNAHSIFGVVLAAVFLRDLERVTWRVAAAAALIVGGVFVVIRFGA
jgi:DME family drug/metabolite transporter